MGNRFKNSLCGYFFIAECFLKQLPVICIILQFGYNTLQGFIHLIRVGNRRSRLQLNVVYTAIPEKAGVPVEVKQGRGVTYTYPFFHTVTYIVPELGKCRKRLVAGRRRSGCRAG